MWLVVARKAKTDVARHSHTPKYRKRLLTVYQAVVEIDGLLQHYMETKRKGVLDLDSLISSKAKSDKQSSSYRKLSQVRRKAALLAGIHIQIRLTYSSVIL
jgi:hypothetical protein